uniref:RNA-directed DNA polymerase n=1 Tax=Acrobeloides nanus TaxID=290746 RepID=A0A914EFL0_9BILA
MASGYHQLVLDAATSAKCGVITESGTYQFTHLPFGLRNATAMFSRCMARVLEGVTGDGVLTYVDDVLVYTKDPDFRVHLRKLRQVFQRFREFNLKLKPTKCEFGKRSVTFLGHTLKKDGYCPAEVNLKLIREYPKPTNLREVRGFLGLASFYRKFVMGFSDIAEALIKLSRKNCKFEWNEKQSKSFERIKEALLSGATLKYPNYEKPFHLFVDASSVAYGAALMQQEEEGKSSYKAISFFSKSLSSAERKWPPVQCELAAIVAALRVFKPFVYMSKIMLHTDHKPLTYLMEKAEMHSNLARWLIELQNYDIKLMHIPGNKNKVADALSRLNENLPKEEIEKIPELEDIIEFPVCLTLEEVYAIGHNRRRKVKIEVNDEKGTGMKVDILSEQKEDENLKPIIKYLETSEHPVGMQGPEIEKFMNEMSLYELDSCGCLVAKVERTKSRRCNNPIVIPNNLKEFVFHSFHTSALGGGHMSVRKTFQKVASKYFWKGMYKDIYAWSRQCLKCQMRNSPRPANRVPMVAVIQNTVFRKVGCDLTGPFKTTERGNRWIVNFICLFSKYVISVPVEDAKSTTLARAFLNNVVLVYGAPTEFLTDNATTFTSELGREICKLLGIEKDFSTPYWSQGNGCCERSFRTFQNILSKYVESNHGDFDLLLPSVTFCYNTTIHRTTDESPYFLMFGRDPCLVVDQILDPKVRVKLDESDMGMYRAQLLGSLHNAWQCAAENSREEAKKYKEEYDRKVKRLVLSYESSEIKNRENLR